MLEKHLQKISNHSFLSKDEAYEALSEIAQGKLGQISSTAFIMAYVMRPPNGAELDGFRNAMLDLALPINLGVSDTIDLCGTGGDGKDTFNISTTASFIVAASGIPVTKHGNYGVSSKVGSSNVIEALGYQFSASENLLKKELQECGITFLHAPLFHPAMKNVSPIRKELGLKTFFNLLGPLVNPSKPTYQFTGVYSPEILPLYAHVLAQSTKRFSVVHAHDVYDEVSLTCPFTLMQEKGTLVLSAQDLNLPTLSAKDLASGNDLNSTALILSNILQGKGTSAQNNVVAVNAGIAIHTVKSISLQKGIDTALELIQSGKAYSLLNKLLQINAGK